MRHFIRDQWLTVVTVIASLFVASLVLKAMWRAYDRLQAADLSISPLHVVMVILGVAAAGGAALVWWRLWARADHAQR